MKIKFKHEIGSDDKVKNEEIIDLILTNRQIKDLQEFINPSSPLKISLADFGPPAGGFKKEIAQTIKLLEKIKKEGGMIVVYTDYDADGITGGAIVWETLNLLGFKAMPYVPHRQLEGYGFSVKGIDAVKKQYDPALIISVDHGISASDKITYAKSLGIPVIVTDHHLQSDNPPKNATAVFHIPELSGSGVAFFFAKEIYHAFKDKKSDVKHLENHFQVDYPALAAIGTIADLVPLTGPSRSIVKYGLEAFSKIRRTGIKCIIKEAGIEGKAITPFEIGFIIAPRINAIGRLEHAIDALRLLCTTKLETAENLASRVGAKNRERQDMVKEAVAEARFLVMKNKLQDKKIIILVSNPPAGGWHEGIIGLIASKISDEFYRPTIVMTKSDRHYKGSARSIPALHITDFLRKMKKLLVDVGGHKQAAGFTVEDNKLKKFVEAAEKKAGKMIADKDLERVVEADLKIPISRVNFGLVRLIEKLQPFGIGNPKPTFYSEVEIVDAKKFGRSYEHLKLYAKDPNQNSLPLELIMFSGASEFFKLSRGHKINIVYNPEIDRWGGGERLRGKLLTIMDF
jgi:single-stranded-DNA-specific exonuclease